MTATEATTRIRARLANADGDLVRLPRAEVEALLKTRPVNPPKATSLTEFQRRVLLAVAAQSEGRGLRARDVAAILGVSSSSSVATALAVLRRLGFINAKRIFDTANLVRTWEYEGGWVSDAARPWLDEAHVAAASAGVA